MAQKRMFNNIITDTDKFLDMPASTQNLYFHLNMHADDDGFVGSPKKVMRNVSASHDDMNILLSKHFVISFDSGIIVIKDWKIHNVIRKDMYKPTVYSDEKSQLFVDDTNSYQLCNEPVPQIRLDKIRLDKTRLDEDREDSSSLIAISEIYQSKIGVIDGDQFQQLTEYVNLDGMELDVVIRAISEAADNGKRNFKYILAILRNWKQNGIKTIAQVEERERQRIEQRANSFQTEQKTQPRPTNVPDWSTEPVKTKQTKEGQKKLAEIFAELEELEGTDG